ncbi:MAG TPA: ATP-binding protein [Pseudonocardiaceae bacterium]|nr:ATP-binding protein [Pseudonocardiaceae bacterium]
MAYHPSVADVGIEDLVLAVSEAASNVADHAYLHGMPGNIEIAGCVISTPSGVRFADMTVLDGPAPGCAYCGTAKPPRMSYVGRLIR